MTRERERNDKREGRGMTREKERNDKREGQRRYVCSWRLHYLQYSTGNTHFDGL